VNTEFTDTADLNGILFYDADCGFCVRLTGRVRPWLASRGFQLLPLQTPGYREQLGLTEAELLAEMWLLLPDGQKCGGADALLEISRHCWWTWPGRQLARLQVVRRWLRGGYGWAARHRHCADGVCGVKRGERSL
jgi:predicted DCC family thiol-disulfide oxidoreductase YuxK